MVTLFNKLQNQLIFPQSHPVAACWNIWLVQLILDTLGLSAASQFVLRQFYL